MQRNHDLNMRPDSADYYSSTGRIMPDQKFEPLPIMPVIAEPKYVHVAPNFLRVDDWVVPYNHITKGTLENLTECAKIWSSNRSINNAFEVTEAIIQRFMERMEERKQ